MHTPTTDHTFLAGEDIEGIMDDLNLSKRDVMETLGLGGVMTVWRWINEESKCEGSYALALRNMGAIREHFGITKATQAEWSKSLSGPEVKKRREKAKLYQGDLAALMGLSEASGHATVSRWETGANSCSGVYALLIRSLELLTQADGVPERSMTQQKAGLEEITAALNVSGNLNEAAESLDVSRRTLNRYLVKYEIDKSSFGLA